MRAETAGWTGGEDKEIQSTGLSWILILETTRKMGQNEYYDKVFLAYFVSLDLGRDRETVAGGERRDFVRVSYLCSDLVWPRATWPRLVLTENERIIIS